VSLHSRIHMTARVLLISFALAAAFSAAAWAGSEQVLYQFKSPQDGQHLLNGVLLLNGKIYGVTYEGGTAGWGTVFELTHHKAGWTKKTLYNFTRGKDGGLPITKLAADKAGNLYGTTIEGGSYLGGCPGEGGAGCGVVFKLTRGLGRGKLTVIHRFNGEDGANPEGNLVWDDAGNLYGTAAGGKSCGVECGDGVVFSLSPPGTAWKYAVIHRFTGGSDGAGPGYLLRGSDGSLYGVTGGGGAHGNGTLFKLSPSGRRWSLTTLYSFTGGAEGTGPSGPLLLSGGVFYGTMWDYGYACGVVYQVARSNGTWQESVLHSLADDGDGCYPFSGVTMDSYGNLYGTDQGGSVGGGYGTIFKLTNSGGTWTESTAFDFNGVDGDTPYSGLVWDAAGNLYGTTYYAGAECQSEGACGNVFEFTPSADPTTQNAQP
jgi:uncharacterized repeat protein (TIGR03803 family)